MPRKLKVFGISSYVDGRLSGQWRYIAAVSSQKEFAKLIDCSLYYVRGYAAETGNQNEVKIAMDNPHKLIGVEPESRMAKQHHPDERWVIL